ncbi:MAG: alpha/beta fold hydrolase [Defluviitaleaceae bacterium]|nr:alpha/beta fold hydrolase [Defluviitaleaceae bacterium]
MKRTTFLLVTAMLTAIIFTACAARRDVYDYNGVYDYSANTHDYGDAIIQFAPVRALFARLSTGAYDAAAYLLHEELRDTGFLSAFWAAYIANYGMPTAEIMSVPMPEIDEQNPGTQTIITVFRHADGVTSAFMVTFDGEGLILGFGFDGPGEDDPTAGISIAALSPIPLYSSVNLPDIQALEQDPRVAFAMESAVAFMTMKNLGMYELAFAMLSPELIASLPGLEFIENAWAEVLSVGGAAIGMLYADGQYIEPLGVVLVEIIMAHDGTSLLSLTHIVVNNNGEITGFATAFQPETGDGVDNTYVPAAVNFIEEEIIIGEGTDFPLPGVLTLPLDFAGQIPAVVIVHGSGPGDRDGTIGVQTPYRDIAHGLARLGIASVRYDKRTLVHNSALAADADMFAMMTVDWETIDDAILARGFLLSDERIDAERIYIIGHSLGGKLAPEIAARGDFAGFIIMAGTLRPITELMVEQLNYQLELVRLQISEMPSDDITPDIVLLFDEAITELELMIEAVTEMHQIFLQSLEKSVEEQQSTYLLGMMAYYLVNLYTRTNPPTYLLEWGGPGLILHGGMDYQTRYYIDFVRYQKLTADMADIQMILYPNLTHSFTVSISETGMGTPADYFVPSTVDEEVIRDIAAFILR